MRTHRATNITPTAPCVLTPVPSPTVTSRYSHITTEAIVSALATRGWDFSSGTARATRHPERASHVAHVLRFNNHNVPRFGDGNVLEVVVMNSSDGSTALEVGLGIYRIACANGLVVRGGAVNGIRLPHVGLTMEDVLEAVEKMVASAPEAVEVVNHWRGIHLRPNEVRGLAWRMARARWGDRLIDIDISTWDQPRREQDHGTDLWTVFNRLQECVVRGGCNVLLAGPDGGKSTHLPKWSKARPLRGAVRVCRLNGMLWEVTGEFTRDLYDSAIEVEGKDLHDPDGHPVPVDLRPDFQVIGATMGRPLE